MQNERFSPRNELISDYKYNKKSTFNSTFNNSISNGNRINNSFVNKKDYYVEFSEGVTENNITKGSFKIYHKDIDKHMNFLSKDANKALKKYDSKYKYDYSDINLKKVLIFLFGFCFISLCIFEIVQVYKRIKSDDQININYCHKAYQENNCDVNINGRIDYLIKECQKLKYCMSHSTSFFEFIINLLRF
jgi:hypothetical protein